jgi:hypothetical protein
VVSQHFLGIIFGAFQLKEDLERQLPRLAALAHG